MLGRRLRKLTHLMMLRVRLLLKALKIASMAAGRTGLVCAGGSKADANVFLAAA